VGLSGEPVIPWKRSLKLRQYYRRQGSSDASGGDAAQLLRAATVEAALRALGTHNASATAQALIALIEGLLLEQVRVGTTLISASQIRSTVFAILSQATQARSQ